MTVAWLSCHKRKRPPFLFGRKLGWWSGEKLCTICENLSYVQYLYHWISNVNTTASVVSGICTYFIIVMIFIPIHAFLPSKGHMLFASNNLQSNLHLNSPHQTRTSALPIVGSMPPPYAVSVVSACFLFLNDHYTWLQSDLDLLHVLL